MCWSQMNWPTCRKTTGHHALKRLVTMNGVFFAERVCLRGATNGNDYHPLCPNFAIVGSACQAALSARTSANQNRRVLPQRRTGLCRWYSPCIFGCWRLLCCWFWLFAAHLIWTWVEMLMFQEILALGICNTLPAFLSSFAVAASLSRTAIQESTGNAGE